MPYKFYNPNPKNLLTSDCVVRAIAKLMDYDWDTAYLRLAIAAFDEKMIISSDTVWLNYLHQNGYRRYMIPDTCPFCYTVRDFAEDHPEGRYMLKIAGSSSGHVVAVVDGDYYDSWDSGNEIPIYYLERSSDNASV